MTVVINGTTGIDTLIDGAVSTTAKLANSIVTPAKLAQPLTLGTAVNTTSGSVVQFTGLPSWIKQIHFLISGVSTAGTFNCGLQLGSTTYTTTGYNGSISSLSSGTGSTSNTSTMIALDNTAAAAYSRYGRVTLSHMGSNLWVWSGVINGGTSITAFTAGSVQLAGVLDRIQLMLNGADTFDAGSVNILYEG